MGQHTHLVIKNAKTHNLKSVSIDIPLKKLIVVKGPSGSGKSSLVFHTIYSESKRKLINSLPTDIKFFWDIPNESDVESIYPVFPVWGLMQSNPIVGSRPTVGDLLGLTEKFQNLFHYFGKPICPTHQVELVVQPDLKVEKFFKKSEGRIHLFVDKDSYKAMTGVFPTRSYNGSIKDFDENDEFWEFARFKNDQIQKYEAEIKQISGKVKTATLIDSKSLASHPCLLTNELRCPECAYSLSKKYNIEMMSPYNAQGACDECKGHGYILKFSREKIVKNPSLSIKEGAIHLLKSSHFSYAFKDFLKECQKQKINLEKPFSNIETEKLWNLIEKGSGKYEGSDKLFTYLDPYRYKRSVRIFLRSYQTEELCPACVGSRMGGPSKGIGILLKKNMVSLDSIMTSNLNIVADIFINQIDMKKYEDARNLIGELRSVLEWVQKMNLHYIPIFKKAKLLSISEYQRSLLVKYLNYQGTDSIIVLDEPSVGLSEKEQTVLVDGLKYLVSEGNTVLVVDHSNFVQNHCDYLIEMGPGSGNKGGEVVYHGKRKISPESISEFNKNNSIRSKSSLEIQTSHFDIKNKKGIVVELNQIHLVKGDSGVGKSQFFLQSLANTISFEVMGETLFDQRPEKKVKIPPELKGCYVFDTKVSRYSSRSTVGSYLDLAPYLRKYFCQLPHLKQMNLKDGHFSPNSELGRCSFCEGSGVKTVDMQFLEDIKLTCDECQGKKLKPFFADVSDGRFKVWQYYQKTIEEIFQIVPLTPKGKRILDLLNRFNLSHLTLERHLGSLSGGEVLRVKLIAQLIRSQFKDSILFFENVSYGLSVKELKVLCQYFLDLQGEGNTIVIIDNHPIFEKLANWRHLFTRNQDLKVSYFKQKLD